MKTKKRILAGSIVFLLTQTNIIAQGLNWQINGNAGITGANYLGTNNAAPLQLRTTLAQPILFQTNGINERMRITPTGLVSISNGLAPLSLLHLNSNGNPIGGEVFRTSGPGANLNAWRMYTGAGNGTERFRLYTQPNNNVFFQTTTANAIYGIRTGNSFTNNIRMLIRGEIAGDSTTGRMALGNSLPETFIPQERLHLSHTNATGVNIRFTNSSTSFGATDGVNTGVQSNGDLAALLPSVVRLTQFEPRNTKLV